MCMDLFCLMYFPTVFASVEALCSPLSGCPDLFALLWILQIYTSRMHFFGGLPKQQDHKREYTGNTSMESLSPSGSSKAATGQTQRTECCFKTSH